VKLGAVVPSPPAGLPGTGRLSSSGVRLRLFGPISNPTVGNHHRESHQNLPVSSAVGAQPNAETGRSFLHYRLLEPNLTPSTLTQPLSAAADHVFRQNIATSCAAIPGVAHRDDGVQQVDKPRRDDESRVHLVGNPSLHTKLTQILPCPASELVCIISPASLRILCPSKKLRAENAKASRLRICAEAS